MVLCNIAGIMAQLAFKKWRVSGLQQCFFDGSINHEYCMMIIFRIGGMRRMPIIA